MQLSCRPSPQLSSHFLSLSLSLSPHRLLLYLSLFGFTLEPRYYRFRFHPPKRFLQHLTFATRLKSPRTPTQHINTSSTNASTPVATIGSNSTTSPNLGAASRKTTSSTEPEVSPKLSSPPPPPPPQRRNSGEMRYTWEYSLLLPATSEEVRSEVDILLSDLIVRLKQLLFNSLLCAYYVGFIPMQFADVSPV